MFRVNFSFKDLKGRLDDIAAKFIPNTKRTLERAALHFIGDIQQKQMSGRRGPRYTNVVTGTLRRDWFHRITEKGKEVNVEVYSTTPYAKYQEYGTSQMRRRLFIREAWARNGISKLRESAVNSFRKL